MPIAIEKTSDSINVIIATSCSHSNTFFPHPIIMKIPPHKGSNAFFPFSQVITWFQNRRAKMKRDIEELKKDVESVKLLTHRIEDVECANALTGQKSFLENVNDMNLLKTKSVSMHNESLSSEK